MINKINTQIVIEELKRRIAIDPEYNELTEIGIEILKDAVAILEGRNRISKNQS